MSPMCQRREPMYEGFRKPSSPAPTPITEKAKGGWGKRIGVGVTIAATLVASTAIIVNQYIAGQSAPKSFLTVNNYSAEGIDGRVTLSRPDGTRREMKLTYGMVEGGGVSNLVAQYNTCASREDFDLAVKVTSTIIDADNRSPANISRNGGGTVYDSQIPAPMLKANTAYPVVINPNCIPVVNR